MRRDGTVIRVRRRRKKQQMKLLCFGVFLLILSLWFSVRAAATANAGTADSSRYKYYTSIEVEKGSSLWDIADVYMTEEYASKKEYMKEIMNINHMKSSTIYEGAFLCIPYYSSEQNKGPVENN